MSKAEASHGGRENEILADLVDRFSRECQEGKAPSIEDYARRHPELADEIRDVFPALELLERAGAPYAEVISGTLSERIASIYGAETDPRLTLPDSEGQDDLSSEIVRRLADRGGT